ncbi:MAG: amidase [Cytophagales bacterium]|nr:amidase [Cytophagales bacterium]
MKNKITLYLFISIVALSSFYILEKKSVTVKNIISALKISGVVFPKKDIETMLSYVERNLGSYEEMRSYTLENNVSPALKFFVESDKNNNTIYYFDPIQTALPENKEEIAFMTIGELSYLIKNKKITSVELTNIYLERIKKYDDALSAVVTLTDSLALEQAKVADKEIASGKYKGVLHGIPYGIKDLASFPGYPTTWGAQPLKNQYLNEKADVIKKLENAGAVMLGKLSSGSLARGDVWFGGKTKNPWDLSQGSSGSSAGSASAVAAGLVGFAIGTETLGSIISPSTRCGVSGLRPTFGKISTGGFMTLSWSMDKVGPIARSARDCAIILEKIKNQPTKPKMLPFDNMGNKFKIGYLKEMFDKDTSRFSSNNNQTISFFSKEYDLTPIFLPKEFPFKVFDVILRSEAGAFFDDFLLQGLDSNMVEQGSRSRANSLRQARLIPAVEYIQANRHRENLIKEVASLFKEFDVILSPSFGGNQLLITNLTGHPVISIPNGFDKKGHPTSISLIGNYNSEHKILYFADIYQKETGHNKINPPLFK